MSDIYEQFKTARQKLLKIRDELNSEYLERGEHVDMLLCAVLSQQHILFVGEKGTAKTSLIKAFFRRVTGAKKFMKTLAIDTSPDEVLGPFDLEKLKHGIYWRNFVGYMSGAQYSIIDEADKTPPAVLDAFLSAMLERVIDGRSTDTRTIAFACNELPDVTGPLFDRIGARLFCNNLEQAAYERMLDGHVSKFNSYPTNNGSLEQALLSNRQRKLQVGEANNGLDNYKPGETTISFEELELLMEARAHVLIPDLTVAGIKKLIKDLADMKITLSARRKGEPLLLFIQAAALLAGRAEALTEDLWVLKHVLWENPDHRKLLEGLVKKIAQPAVSHAKALRDQITQTCDTLAKEIEAAGTFMAMNATWRSKSPQLQVTVESLVNLIPDYRQLLDKAREEARNAGADEAGISRAVKDTIENVLPGAIAAKPKLSEMEQILQETVKKYLQTVSTISKAMNIPARR